MSRDEFDDLLSDAYCAGNTEPVMAEYDKFQAYYELLKERLRNKKITHLSAMDESRKREGELKATIRSINLTANGLGAKFYDSDMLINEIRITLKNHYKNHEELL